MPYEWCVSHLKSYTKAEKYRCVARGHVYLDEKERLVRSFFEAAGINREKFERYWRKRPGGSTSDGMKRCVEYFFSPGAKCFPGRFNTADFPALYTAKEEETAYQEKRYYIMLYGDTEFKFVIFSVEFSGRAVDLRPFVLAGSWTMSENHAECQQIATVVRSKGFDGIAAPSRRNVGGSCCAILAIGGVQAKEVVREGLMRI